MRISTVHDDPAAYRLQGITFLTRTLDQPTLDGVELPNSLIRATLYVNGVRFTLERGVWEIQSPFIYLGRSGSMNVAPMDRLAVLAGIANLTEAITDPTITDKLTSRLAQIISESAKCVYHGIITAGQKPTRIAIDPVNLQVAGELHGVWTTPGGIPVEVTPAWTTIDF